MFFVGDVTHVNTVDGLEEVKLDVKYPVVALPQIPVEAAARVAIPEYSCFDKGCPTKALKRTRQCRLVLWVERVKR